MIFEQIQKLREASQNGKLVVFAGAGVSMNSSGMPSWNDLVKEFTTELKYSRCTYCKGKVHSC